MRFHSRSYQTLPSHPDGRTFGELTLSPCGDNLDSAAAYIRNHEAPANAYHLVYDGLGVSLTESPQLIPANLVRLDGSPALTGHYMVDILPVNADSNPLERFVSSGRQLIPDTKTWNPAMFLALPHHHSSAFPWRSCPSMMPSPTSQPSPSRPPPHSRFPHPISRPIPRTRHRPNF